MDGLGSGVKKFVLLQKTFVQAPSPELPHPTIRNFGAVSGTDPSALFP